MIDRRELHWAQLAHLAPSSARPFVAGGGELPRQRPSAIDEGLWKRAAERARRASWVGQHRIWLRRCGGPGYPRRLLELDRPPLFLFGRGRDGLLGGPLLAVVGTRRCSADGRWAARSLARAASTAGVPVVSGLALGIDGAAHQGALEGAGSTVAVLAGGVLHPSPRSHVGLARRIAESGLLLSEAPPESSEMQPWRFVQRNRVIAALATAVLVVEAGPKSGALITAARAEKLGRPLWAVPGSLRYRATRGSNALLKAGASLVASEGDLLQLLGCSADAAGQHADPLVQALAAGAERPAELAVELGIDERSARRRLLQLELRGCVCRLPGDRYQAVG
jgi:DNA processing protein